MALADAADGAPSAGPDADSPRETAPEEDSGDGSDGRTPPGTHSGAHSEADSGSGSASATASRTESATEAPTATRSGAEPETTAEAHSDTETGEGTAALRQDSDQNSGQDGVQAEGQELSEAQAELAAQRELRERIERRKAAKEGPLTSGGKLSGSAADLLAAVRAVESGERSGGAFFPPAAPAAPAPSAPALPRSSISATPPAAAPAPAAPPLTPPAPAAVSVSPETAAAVRHVLSRGGAPESLAAGVVETLGERAVALLQEDPWQLLSVPGVQPDQADGFARALLGGDCGPGDERRTAALVIWRLEAAARQGHTALDATVLRAALAERAVPDPDEALGHAVAEGLVLLFDDGAEGGTEGGGMEEGHPEGDGPQEGGPAADGPAGAPDRPVLLGLDRYAMAEESLADGLARLARSGPDARWDQAGPADLVRAVAAGALVVHTGGEASRAEPLALAEAARALGLRATVATLGEGGPRPAGAVTLAGLLAGAEGPARDEEGALALDLLVVLDASLLDVESAAMLVESLPDGARLVLSGDPHGLGPAGAGQVLADLLAAKVCPRVASRVPDPGPIGELVSGIGIGELNAVAAPAKEVVIVPVREPGEAVHRTVQLVADSVPRAIGVPADQTQVITVGHGGAAGTRALNAALKQRLNPGPGRFGGFDPGDRVAYTPAPGRTLPCRVVSADADGLLLDREGGGRVTVPRERVAATLRHGWALTAHQAAALRWPAVVVVLPGDAAPGLSRPWVYTAFSRGVRHLSVVHGVEQALLHAVSQPPAARTTRLPRLLTPPA
ncbi:helix-hairpin-helix domain-containing protein [Streptomyces sp. NPDC057638]|uniref:helix-hairpin-helix domain-containing protein n=1 Tax=Streptomyces sp. NPDC057638 TaxID=3346190 RepID=UPI0036961D1B